MQPTQTKTAILTGLVVLSSLFFVSGCLPLLSVQPLYSDDTLIFEEKLLGKWYGEDQTWQFTSNGGNKYALEVMDKEGKGQFEVHLVKLQEKLFLDLYPQKSKEIEKTALVYQIGLMPVHIILYAESIEDQLILRLVHSEKIIENDPNALKYVMMDDCPLVTSSPQELQQAIIDNFLSKEVLDKDQNIFYRSVPLYSEKDITFSEQLVGQWQSEDSIIDCIAWENGYDIIASDNGRDSSFKAYLVNIDQQLYWALFAIEPSQEDKTSGLNLCPDLLFRITQMEPELKIQQLDLMKCMELGLTQCQQDQADKTISVFRKL